MWVFDLKHMPFWKSTKRHSTLRYSREEFLTKTLADIRQSEKNGRPKTAALDTADRNVIWRQRRKDGSLIDVEVVWSPIVFGEHFAALTMAPT